ncbi:nitric oxide synthase oxygenase [Kutzneria buriramensis]|uniref:Nitric-oxide synthase n=1 Tax=Kutzneria buriramensis TaxID=1045776 RepID=A0A3E0GXT7_9PSEU|nr:nitric oxide synthase oxygenase [Kutzneria buriramensis]REH31083.1 nitric-oxide synthase [Kutzneria buriramensis]
MTISPHAGRTPALPDDPVTADLLNPAVFGPLFSLEEVKRRAARFLGDPALPGDRNTRVAEALDELDRTGTYRLASTELSYGLKQAWRADPRCIRRGMFDRLAQVEWDDLERADFSGAKLTTDLVAGVIGYYVRSATNRGRLTPKIMVFPPDGPDGPALRIWNDQLIRYAAERQSDGRVLGDPAQLKLTAAVRRLGWSERVGRQTVLPIAFQIGRSKPELITLSRKDVLEVPLQHPEYPWIAELEFKWHALPAISRMVAIIGGLVHPVLFSGWYVAGEILDNCRRYGIVDEIAERLDLGPRDRLRSHRVDLVVLEAVLYSFREAGVMIEDNRSADLHHHQHVLTEAAAGTTVRGDKSKLMLAGSTSDMHARTDPMLPPDRDQDPGFHYLPDAWPSAVSTPT